MPAIIPIVEGEGDVDAVPRLIDRTLAFLERWDWTVGPPKKCGGVHALRAKLPNFLWYAQSEPECGAILILVDLDDGCPFKVSQDMVQQIQSLHLTRPVAIVLAHREYETWFLASLATIAGSNSIPEGTIYEGAVELRRGAKEWLSKQMPPGKAYKETIHQARMTAKIDIPLAKTNSRSFRRFVHAIEELVDAADGGDQNSITPSL